MPTPIYIYDFQVNSLKVIFLNEPNFICLQTVKQFSVLISNTDNPI